MMKINCIEIKLNCKKILMKDMKKVLSVYLNGHRAKTRACVLVGVMDSGMYILIDNDGIRSSCVDELLFGLRHYNLVYVNDITLLRSHLKKFYEFRQLQTVKV